MKRKGLTMTARHIAQVRRFGKWGSMKPRELRHEQRALGTIPGPSLSKEGAMRKTKTTSRDKNKALRAALASVKVDETTLGLVRATLAPERCFQCGSPHATPRADCASSGTTPILCGRCYSDTLRVMRAPEKDKLEAILAHYSRF